MAPTARQRCGIGARLARVERVRILGHTGRRIKGQTLDGHQEGIDRVYPEQLRIWEEKKKEGTDKPRPHVLKVTHSGQQYRSSPNVLYVVAGSRNQPCWLHEGESFPPRK